jgi:hypothetical protein
MTNVNSVNGSGQEDLSVQTAKPLSESAEINESSSGSDAMEVGSDGSEIETAGGIKPGTIPMDYADGFAEPTATDEKETGISGVEELNSHEVESARKEQIDNSEKVLKHMEQIYLGEKTEPESLGETAGQKEDDETSQVDTESS